MTRYKDKPITFPLDRLHTVEFGVTKGLQVLISLNTVKLAKIKGQWYALNYRSECPSKLGNRSARSDYAHLLGLKPKEVEAYVRHKKNADRKEAEKEQIEEAIRVLTFFGYEVTK